jgi:hypothetical protein
MADIDQIIAGGAGASSRADFSGLSKIFDPYYKGRDEFAKNDLRDTFKEGLPMKGDQPDWGAISKTFFQKGAIEQGMAAANQGLAQQKQEYGQKMGESAFPSAGQPQPTIVSPPSANRSASTVVAPPLNKGGVSPQEEEPAPAAPARGGQPPATVMGVVSAQGFPNTEIQKISESIARQLGVDPTAPLDINDPKVRNVLAPALAQFKRMNLGQVQPAGGPPQQATPQAPPIMAQAPQGAPPQPVPQQAPPDFNARFNAARPGQSSDPTLGGLVPAGRSASQQIDGLSRAIASGMLTPEQAKAYQSRIEAITKAIEPTGPMKEYDKAVQQGFKGTLEDWQNRADDNTTERDILTKSLLPKIDKSQETAVAARDDISAIHRSREELDQNGGVFSGAFADKKLYLAKVAEALGIPDAGAIKNTEAYGAAIGSRVASMVKAFGSGTAISDGDRRFAAAMAGGQVTLDEKSMRRILDIGEQAARGKIEQHNTLADKIVGANKALKDAKDTYIVQPPGAYKRPEAGKTAAPASTIASKADYDKLPVGSVFTGPDGKQWRKQ